MLNVIKLIKNQFSIFFISTQDIICQFSTQIFFFFLVIDLQIRNDMQTKFLKFCKGINIFDKMLKKFAKKILFHIFFLKNSKIFGPVIIKDMQNPPPPPLRSCEIFMRCGMCWIEGKNNEKILQFLFFELWLKIHWKLASFLVQQWP